MNPRQTMVTFGLLLGAVVTSCATPTGTGSPPPRAARAAPPGASASATDDPVAGRSRPTHAARPAAPRRAPPPRTTAPMKGEPTPASLAEARLLVSSCEAATAEEVGPALAAMRAAVDASFQEWRDEQPECWRQMREEYLERKELERAESAGGGLGLRGIGSGAGGAAIALGAIGTVGHGAGTAAAHRSAEGDRAHRTSGTNNQIASVDEADLVKTDGRYLYLAANGALRIVAATDPKVVSVTRLPGTARELFVEGDRAVVYTSSGAAAPHCTYGYDCAFRGDGSSTTILVLDVANREAPRITRELTLSGSLVAARRIGSAVHTVVADGDAPQARRSFETWPPDLGMCGTPEAKVREAFARLKLDNERALRARAAEAPLFPTLRERGKETRLCAGLLRTPIRDGKAFTSVVSFDLRDDTTAPTTATLQSRPGAVFASGDALYLSVVHQRSAAKRGWYSFYPSVDEASEIHKFTIGEKAQQTRYVGSGVVPGHVLNQFAMDEWNGYLRVATTRGRVPDPRVSSSISVLAEVNGSLVRVGAVDELAPGEDIRAVRFDDDRGYVVTFKKTDPLFVVDLYQPAQPKVLGELKIPGFSTYLHRLDPDHLLSIGFDANDHGDFAYFDGVILQLFDVTSPTAPRLVHKEKLGSRGSSSQAAVDHLAFNYFADEGLLAIPMTLCDGGGDGKNGDTLSFSGLVVYDVDLDRGFTRLGGVDHGTRGVTCSTWWSQATSAVKRSVFVDDLVYSVAEDRVKVQRVSRLGVDVADLPLAN